DDAATKKEIQAAYQRMAAGIRNKDLKSTMDCLSPDFVNVGENGRKDTRAQFEVEMRQMIASIKRVDRLSFNVEKIIVKGSEAKVDCRSRMLMQIMDKDGNFGQKGRSHQLEADTLDKETWVKDKKGWLLKSSVTQPGGKFLIDGQAPAMPQPPSKK